MIRQLINSINSFLRIRQLHRHSQNSQHFMEFEISLLVSVLLQKNPVHILKHISLLSLSILYIYQVAVTE
jgi:hypothetical protein